MAVEEDPFDTILSLEDDFYKEGYDLGVSDGDKAGLVEGRWFGLEKGFEKYVVMGKLHGRAMIWAGRLPGTRTIPEPRLTLGTDAILSQAPKGHAPLLPTNTRFETHVRTLYALTEPGSLSTENNEDSVSDFNDRLKRTEGKVKILEKLTGELSYEEMKKKSPSQDYGVSPKNAIGKKGDGSIEDISSLHIKH